MDKLSKLLTDTFGKKVASKVSVVPVPELNIFEKRAYGMALSQACQDESFLAQFEGTPLAPQAIALAEQELAMEGQQLQKRMQRAAQQQNEDWQQDCIQQDQIRLQKQQLVLELYKMKAMTPAPKPGDAEIGAPQPGAEMINDASAGGTTPGAVGGAPVEEVAAPKMAALADWVPGPDTASLDPAAQKQMAHRVSLLHGALGVGAGGVLGAEAGSEYGGRGALIGGLAGAGIGGLANYAGMRLNHGMRHAIDSGRTDTKGRGTSGGKLMPEDNRLLHHLNKMIVGKDVYAQAPKEAAVTEEQPKLAALIDTMAQSGWNRRIPSVKGFARTVSGAAKVV